MEIPSNLSSELTVKHLTLQSNPHLNQSSYCTQSKTTLKKDKKKKRKDEIYLLNCSLHRDGRDSLHTKALWAQLNTWSCSIYSTVKGSGILISFLLENKDGKSDSPPILGWDVSPLFWSGYERIIVFVWFLADRVLTWWRVTLFLRKRIIKGNSRMMVY